MKDPVHALRRLARLMAREEHRATLAGDFADARAMRDARRRCERELTAFRKGQP